MRGEAAATILVVEDDEATRQLIITLLRGATHKTVEAASGEAALASAGLTSLDLVILDVGLPGLCGYEVCRRLRAEHGDGLPIMFVSGIRTEAFDRVAGLLIGGHDYLTKPFAPEELLARVDVLLRRSALLAPTANGSPTLTKREHQVLTLLAAGLAQREIAAELVISPRTVATHVEHVLTKLGVHSRAQAVAAAYREGFVRSS